MEMDSDLQVPGWGNIWTRPIQNRVDMLATGVRTMVGVKIFAQTPEEIQKVSDDVAKVLKTIRGAVDVFPDQTVGENYLEIAIDRKKAARYGVSVQDIQDVIEVALGGKEITMTVEGRQRYPVRVRYPRDFREDEERVGNILVPMGGGGRMSSSASDALAMGGGSGAREPRGSSPAAAPGARLGQIPLSQVAQIKIVPGPSMIKSENGQLRSYVQLNVRDRDIVGFVEEARQAVASDVKLPPRSSVEWSGQFEHQVRAQKTLTIVFPIVIVIIFVILFMTYRDLPDTVMMFLAVPGAIAGGAIFQWIFGFSFSVAVWVGYVACFGLATETGIIMMVYLREAIQKRGGLHRFRSEEEIREAVIQGAVHRLRPKLLTEATMVLALIPMLWSSGVGSEFMKPMAAPILGGILVADEVIDILIPVLFYWERCRRFRKLRAGEGEGSGPEGRVPTVVPLTET
jgi:Cu(I)/Ag(I) efflux system membrane protein CusA/SilA